MSHDYAGCGRPDCLECAAYDQGWVYGKQKLAADVDTVLTAGHAVDCGCTPCGVVAAVLDTLDTRLQQLDGSEAETKRRCNDEKERISLAPDTDFRIAVWGLVASR